MDRWLKRSFRRRTAEFSPRCHQDQEVPSPLGRPAHPARESNSYSVTIRRTVPSTASAGRGHLVGRGRGNRLTASLLFTALNVQIPLSCCRFLIHWHLEHCPLFSLLFLADFHYVIVPRVQMNLLFLKFLERFMRGIVPFLRNRGGTH